MKKILIFCFIFIIYPTTAISETLYDVLGLKPGCSPEDIEPAYKRMIRAFHPDLNKSSHATPQSQKNSRDLIQIISFATL